MAARIAAVFRFICEETEIERAIEGTIPIFLPWVRALTTLTTKTKTLCASFGQQISSEPGKWNLLFPLGKWHGYNFESIGGSFEWTPELVAEAIQNWNDAGRPLLPVYKTHLHLKPDLTVEEKLLANKSHGLIADLRSTDAGLEAMVKFTDAGKDAIDSGEFFSWSGEWDLQHICRLTGKKKGVMVNAAALCNDPYYNTMPALAASASIDASPKENQKPEEKQKMNPFKKRLSAAMKMPEETGDDELCAAFEKVCASLAASEKNEATLSASMAATNEATKGAFEVVQKQLAELKAKEFAREVETVVASGIAQGKPLAASMASIQKLGTIGGIDAVKEFVASMPVTMPTSVVGHSQPGPTEPVTLLASMKTHAEGLEKFAKAKGIKESEAMFEFNALNPELAKAVFSIGAK